MRFKPKSEKELAEANLWPNGNYPYEILEAEEAQDSQGSDMLKLKVKVSKDTGASKNIFDYVSGEWMEFKLRHLAEASGLIADYEAGELQAYDLIGKTGQCKLGVSKDKSGQYPDQNRIMDYLTGNETPKTSVHDNDEIPF